MLTAYCRWFKCRVEVTENLEDLITSPEYAYIDIKPLDREPISSVAPLQTFINSVPKSTLDQYKFE